MADNIYIDTKELKKIAIELSKFPNTIKKATIPALNRTLDHVVAKTAKEVSSNYSVKQKDVKTTMKKHKASGSDLHAYVESSGKSIALQKFPHTPTKYSKKAKAVKVSVIKSKGKVEIGGNPKSFVQQMTNTTGIWRRKNRSRKSVVLLRSLSIPQMISNDKVIKNVQQSANEMLQKRIEHEVNRQLEKAGGKK